MPSDLLVESAVKATIVLLAAAMVTRSWLPRASAAMRSLVWTAAMIGVLIVPLFVAFSPRWRFDALQTSWSALLAPRVPSSTIAPTRQAPPDGRAPGLAPEDLARRAATVDPDSLFPATPAPAAPRGPWRAWLVVVWFLGATIGILRVASGLGWAAWLVQRAAPLAAPEWKEDAGVASTELGVEKTVPLLVSGRTGVPATCGIVRSAIILPPESVAWSADRRRAVLLHELAHVRRRDCLVRAIAELVVALHWFNPLSWLAASRLRAEQERACDDLVLAAGMNGPDYAHHLCELADESRAQMLAGWATLAMARSSHLAGRVDAILDASRRRQRPTRRSVTVTLAVAALSVATLGALELTARDVVGPDSVREQSVARGVTSGPQPNAVPANVRAPQAVQPREGDARVEPTAFLNEFCAACHNTARRVANLALDTLNLDDLSATADTWERVVRKVRSGLHPPSGVPRPDVVRSSAFLTLVEHALDRADQANWGPDAAERLTDMELSERLAAFLWGGAPDAELRRLAERGRLTNPSELERQARRMLADPRSAAWRRGFFGQWLSLRGVDQVTPDPTLFPGFDDSLRTAFRRETELFVDSQVADDRSVPELLTADYTFVNERLARHYGIANVTGAEFRRVSITDEARVGLLGQASILTLTSYATRTSPVLRGKFVLEMFLGTPPPPPPPNVPALKESDPQQPQPLRQRMEDSVKAPVCASCHSLMDPIGFSLENFDAIGQWRDTDAGVPIDASGTLSDATTFTGPAGFRIALVERSDALVRTLAERLLAYALAGDATSIGARRFHMPAVRSAVARAAADNYRWSSLISGIVTSTPFQMRRLK